MNEGLLQPPWLVDGSGVATVRRLSLFFNAKPYLPSRFKSSAPACQFWHDQWINYPFCLWNKNMSKEVDMEAGCSYRAIIRPTNCRLLRHEAASAAGKDRETLSRTVI